jgi:hypothetical protein
MIAVAARHQWCGGYAQRAARTVVKVRDPLVALRARAADVVHVPLLARVSPTIRIAPRLERGRPAPTRISLELQPVLFDADRHQPCAEHVLCAPSARRGARQQVRRTHGRRIVEARDAVSVVEEAVKR